MELHVPGFTFDDLFIPSSLARLTDLFREDLRKRDPSLAARYIRYIDSRALSHAEISTILVDLAPRVSEFIVRLFGIEEEYGVIKNRASRDSVIFSVRKEFVERKALKRYTSAAEIGEDLSSLERQAGRVMDSMSGLPVGDAELALASAIRILLDHARYLKSGLPPESEAFIRTLAVKTGEPRGGADPAGYLTTLTVLFEKLVARLCYEGGARTKGWGLLRIPHPVDYERLVDTVDEDADGATVHSGPASTLRRRDGFTLTDERFTPREVEGEVDYCIICHEREKDTCSRGFAGAARKNPLGFELAGCPLDQKISESHLLMRQGDPLGALAIIMVDNPMVPGTGHRICNDCMKSCIFQKQDPVNIPQAETGILTSVLGLPWGFEIWSLLTRWNPLNAARPHALPYNGLNILIVGLGPAGYTLAHYFLNEGFGVVALDGLKIEPPPPGAPVRDVRTLGERLDRRILAGFGGVSEYGITVRWDKNFLTLLHLNLARRPHFRIHGGVRFGGTLTLEDAWSYGFAHVCLATGAGKPSFVAMKNNLLRGVRKASDFLMGLQLTGAAKESSLANLQVRLPAVVIGGGLTAIDTATELMAYYPVQVTKIRKRYDALVARYGKESIERLFDGEENEILGEFLAHARALEDERTRAAARKEAPDIPALVRSWGGVRIFYRKAMLDSPAYRLNHEEIIKSLEEGIAFVDCMNPAEAVPDARGAVSAVIFERTALSGGAWKGTGETLRVPARSVMVAAGTSPNVMYEREHPGTFALGREFFTPHVLEEGPEGKRLAPAAPGETGFFTSYAHNGRYVSYYGDNHPAFAGNVVRAMASAKEGHREVLRLLEGEVAPARAGAPGEGAWDALAGRLDDDLTSHVVALNRLAPDIVEVVVRAKQAARAFRPGQFYRLQDYETDARTVEGTALTMEGIALTGAWVDREAGTIGLIALELGASSRLCALLEPGRRVVVMGPTGAPTEITENGTVLLLGGGLGNAVLFSIARAFREKNNRVIYFAGYRNKEGCFKREEIEAGTDVVVYSVDAGPLIETRRANDRSVRGTIIDAMLLYARGELGPVPIPLAEAGRVIAIGSDRMMAAVAEARHGILRQWLNTGHVAIASINSPMQCMMKAVCAQCLQRHVDPLTGKEEFVFTCVNQDQLMDEVDFAHLAARLRSNSVMEKLTRRWLDYLLESHPA